MNGTHDVFLSYKFEEKAEALAVKRALESAGLTCWMAPESISGGSSYADEIDGAIRGCSAFVLILSERAQSSPWIKKEIDVALNAGKLVLPFLIEEVRLQNAFSFYLSDVQQYRAYENREDALRSLIGRVRAVSGKAGDAAPLPAPETAAARPPKRPARALLWAGACIGGALLLALVLTFFDLQDGEQTASFAAYFFSGLWTGAEICYFAFAERRFGMLAARAGAEPPSLRAAAGVFGAVLLFLGAAAISAVFMMAICVGLGYFLAAETLGRISLLFAVLGTALCLSFRGMNIWTAVREIAIYTQEGWFMWEDGDLDSAAEAFEESVRLCEAALFRSPTRFGRLLAACRNGMALLCRARGDTEGAQRRLRDAIEAYEEAEPGVFGASYPELACLYSNLGAIFAGLGETEQAEAQLLRGLDKLGGLPDFGPLPDADAQAAQCILGNLCRLYRAAKQEGAARRAEADVRRVRELAGLPAASPPSGPYVFTVIRGGRRPLLSFTDSPQLGWMRE